MKRHNLKKFTLLTIAIITSVMVSACSAFEDQPDINLEGQAEPMELNADDLDINEMIIDFEYELDGVSYDTVVFRPTMEANVPLVVDMHGWGGTSAEHLEESGMAQFALAEGFIIIYPQAGNTGEERLWSPQDVPYIDALIELAIEEYQVDTSRIYVMGASAGGAMAQYYGAIRSEQVAAITSIVGLMPVFDEMVDTGGIIADAAQITNFERPADPDRAMPVFMYHGLDDDVVPYEAAERSARIWAEFNGCDLERKVYGVEEAGPSTVVYEGCEDGLEVTLQPYVGGHGAPEDAAALAWGFMSQYALQ